MAFERDDGIIGAIGKAIFGGSNSTSQQPDQVYGGSEAAYEGATRKTKGKDEGDPPKKERRKSQPRSIQEQRRIPGYQKPERPISPSAPYMFRKVTHTKKDQDELEYRDWERQRTNCVCGCGNEPVVFPSTGSRGYCINCAPDDLLSVIQANSASASIESRANACGYIYDENNPAWDYGED